jgi:hypothetical protein
MIKIIASLIWQRKGVKQWQLEIGAYLLEKGCGYKIGQAISSKPIGKSGKNKVKYIEGLTYDFGTKQIYHRSKNTII